MHTICIRYRIRLLVLVVLASTFAHADAALSQSPASGSSWPLPKDELAILVPVEFKGQHLTFLVDTGAGISLIDSRFAKDLGQLLDTRKMHTLYGTVEIDRYAAPDLAWGGMSLKLDYGILCKDLSAMRRVMDIDVDGVIGADALKGLLLSYDPDARTVSLVDSPPHRPSVPLKTEHGSSAVDIYFSDGSSCIALLDTGGYGYRSGTLAADLIDGLVKKGLAVPEGENMIETIAGATSVKTYRIGSTRVSDFDQRQLVFAKGDGSTVNLAYLSRFKFVMDFKNQRVYFTPSKRFDIPDPVDRGIGIWRLDGNVMVASIPKGDSKKPGVDVGDELLAVDGVGVPPPGSGLFTIRSKLRSPEPVQLQLRSGGQLKTVVVQ